jgi:hypothetical protein
MINPKISIKGGVNGSTVTTVSCFPNPVSIGSSVNCTASVSGVSPTGNVTWSTSSGTGYFSPPACVLVSGACSTTYTDNNTGYRIITANYYGDINNSPSNGSTVLTVFIDVSEGTNRTVQPTNDFGLTFSNVVVAGNVIVNPTPVIHAPPLNGSIGPYYDVIVAAVYSGNVTVKLAFLGLNMTQQQKNNLRMMEYTPLVGDVSGAIPGVPDGVVNMRDITYIILHFNTTPVSPNWDPNCDIYGPGGGPDGKVNMRDISYDILQFGKTSSWMDITWYVDTDNNIIYGQTTHFSFIGIH